MLAERTLFRTPPKHPATYSKGMIALFAELLQAIPLGSRVLDPFAGVGTIHELVIDGYDTVGVELEPEWAKQHPRTVVGDARNLPFGDASFQAAVTSPTYGNRMADNILRDKWTRRTYAQMLGRRLSHGNSGSMQWGWKYRQLHQEAWLEVRRVLEPGGLFILNLRDHIRRGQLMPVTGWHATFLIRNGFELLNALGHYAPGYGMGSKGQRKRPGNTETVFLFRKLDAIQPTLEEPWPTD